MKLFQKRQRIVKVPDVCKDFAIEVDKSICTGEMTVGFRNPVTGKLLFAELANNDADIEAYKKKYGR